MMMGRREFMISKLKFCRFAYIWFTCFGQQKKIEISKLCSCWQGPRCGHHSASARSKPVFPTTWGISFSVSLIDGCWVRQRAQGICSRSCTTISTNTIHPSNNNRGMHCCWLSHNEAAHLLIFCLLIATDTTHRSCSQESELGSEERCSAAIGET